MIEVFVAFTKGVDPARLERTLEAWNIPGLEPVAIQCGLKKFELHRRVTAENISHGPYILAAMDYGPVEEDFWAWADQELLDHPLVGLFLIEDIHTLGKPVRCHNPEIVMCRKGVITHWPQPQTDSYGLEVMETCKALGIETQLCRTIHYRRLAESLPLS